MLPVAAERLPEILESYERNPADTLRRLDEVFEQRSANAPPLPRGEALSVALRSRGAEFFVAYLMRRDELFPLLLDPHGLSMDDATAALKFAMQMEPGCDVAQLESMVRAPHTAESLTRLIDLASRVRLSGRLRPVLERLRDHENPFLSSKVDLMLKRLDLTERSMWQRLKDPDPRVQADAVEALWGEDTQESREIFLRAINSPSDRLVGNGLYGLYLLGDTTSIRIAFDLAENQSPVVRPTAIWFMGQTGDPRFLPWLVEAMGTSDNRLRSRIFQAIRQIRERRAQAAAAGKLRTHILSAALTAQRERVVRFTVAGNGRPVIRRLLATQVLFTEADRSVLDYTIRPTRQAPAEIVALCCGGAEVPGDVETMLGPADRFEARILSAASIEQELEALTGRSVTDVIVVAGGSALPELNRAQELTEKLRAARKRVHAVWPETAGVRQSLPLDALAKGTGGWALRFRDSVASCVGQAALAALEVHELRYQLDSQQEGAAPVHLQLVSYRGFGEASSLLVRRGESSTE